MLFLYAPVFLLIVFSFNASPMSDQVGGTIIRMVSPALSESSIV